MFLKFFCCRNVNLNPKMRKLLEKENHWKKKLKMMKVCLLFFHQKLINLIFFLFVRQ